MKDWRKRDIAELLLNCGEIAMRSYEAPERSIKEDHSVVTAADKEIESFLTRELSSPGQGSYIIGEETVASYDESYISAALRKTAWIVDPIDGTAPYANHIPTWGISLAMMENSVLKEGAIYLPALNELYITDGEDLLWAPSCPKKGKDAASALRHLPPFERRLDESVIIGLSQKMAKEGCYHGAHSVQAICSCVYSMTGLLTGRYMGYVATVKLWDIAAGLVMALRRGLSAQLLTGAPLGFEVAQSCYELSPGARQRWRLHGHAIFAPDSTVADEILKCSEFPR